MAISSLFSVCGVRDVNDAEELLKEDAPDANVKLFVLNVGPAFKVGGLSGVKLVNPVWLNPFLSLQLFPGSLDCHSSGFLLYLDASCMWYLR